MLLKSIKLLNSNSTTRSIITDTYGRIHNYLRISLIEKCNLRCTYCMPENGITLTPNEKILTTEEIIKLSYYFIKIGKINKIRFTGGEPTIRKDLIDIFQEVNKFRIHGLNTLAITTNGLILSRLLNPLINNGLDVVNISLDTFDPLQFELITRRKGHDKVLKSIHDAIELKENGLLRDVKVNCVVMKNINHQEIMKFAEFTKDNNVQVRFIEYMPFSGNKWSNDKLVPYKTMINIINSKYPIESVADDKDKPNETSKTYQIPGFKGKIGFISSMSNHFCATCNRLRLTSDGNIKVCLFDSKEVSLRDILRSKHLSNEQINAQLTEVINLAVADKKPSHGGMSSPEEIAKSTSNRPMITIGG